MMDTPPVVSAQEWEAARQRLLVQEKELTRARDAMAAQRRRMPWLRVEKKYAFDGPAGRMSLPDLFEGRRQLVIYRAFFEPDQTPRSPPAPRDRRCRRTGTAPPPAAARTRSGKTAAP